MASRVPGVPVKTGRVRAPGTWTAVGAALAPGVCRRGDHVKTKPLLEGLPWAGCGLHAGLADEAGRQVSPGIPGIKALAQLSGYVQDS